MKKSFDRARLGLAPEASAVFLAARCHIVVTIGR